METLITGLRHKLYFMLAFTPLSLAGILYSDNKFIITLLTTTALVNGLLFVFIFLPYRKLNRGLSPEFSALEAMKQVYTTVKKVLQMEELVVLTSQPIMLMAAALLGASVGGRDVEELLGNRLFLVVLAAILVIGLFLTYWLGRKMTQKAFGQYLDKLQQNMDTLEQEG